MLLSALLTCAFFLSVSPASPDPDEVWRQFVKWASAVEATPDSGKSLRSVYTEYLVSDGVAREEAERRARIVEELGVKGGPRSLVYWNAVFKAGSGPERPLRLLAETVRDLAPGAALDVAMGNGRNSVYLAGLGWRVTGYDISSAALSLARQRAARMKTTIETVEAAHEDFVFGQERWDLIVLSYVVPKGAVLDVSFARRLCDSLRPRGRIVCEGHYCESFVRTIFPLELKGFRLERYSDTEELRDSWTAPDVKARVVRAVLRKGAATE
jgi:SAM-dependent methyltransferase